MRHCEEQRDEAILNAAILTVIEIAIAIGIGIEIDDAWPHLFGIASRSRSNSFRQAMFAAGWKFL
ncbi:MAG: hypothetical protein ACOZBW_00195 [Thermodesulfobacteriota bacterium]